MNFHNKLIILDIQDYLHFPQVQVEKEEELLRDILKNADLLKRKGSRIRLYFPMPQKIVETLKELSAEYYKERGNRAINDQDKGDDFDIITNPQFLFFEMGKYHSTGHGIVIYSNNKNFLHRDFAQNFRKNHRNYESSNF